MSFSLSTTVFSSMGEPLYTFEYAALITETSISLVQVYVALGAIEANGSMLHSREISRIAQIERLRHDLKLTISGAAMVLDMAQEIIQLRAQLKAYQVHHRSPSP